MPVSRRGLCDHASGRIIRAAANAPVRAASKLGAQAAQRQMADLMKRTGAKSEDLVILSHDRYEQAKAEGGDVASLIVPDRRQVAVI